MCKRNERKEKGKEKCENKKNAKMDNNEIVQQIKMMETIWISLHIVKAMGQINIETSNIILMEVTICEELNN